MSFIGLLQFTIHEDLTPQLTVPPLVLNAELITSRGPRWHAAGSGHCRPLDRVRRGGSDGAPSGDPLRARLEVPERTTVAMDARGAHRHLDPVLRVSRRIHRARRRSHPAPRLLEPTHADPGRNRTGGRPRRGAPHRAGPARDDAVPVPERQRRPETPRPARPTTPSCSDRISERPWFGHGFGTYQPEIYRVLDNQLLGQLVSSGFVVTAALVGLVGTSIWCTHKTIVSARRAETKHPRGEPGGGDHRRGLRLPALRLAELHDLHRPAWRSCSAVADAVAPVEGRDALGWRRARAARCRTAHAPGTSPGVNGTRIASRRRRCWARPPWAIGSCPTGSVAVRWSDCEHRPSPARPQCSPTTTDRATSPLGSSIASPRRASERPSSSPHRGSTAEPPSSIASLPRDTRWPAMV